MARKSKKQEGGGGAPEWMTTYSDLVTLLLCFFVMLYAGSNVDSGKIQAISNSFRGASQFQPTLSNHTGTGINYLIGNGITQMPLLTMDAQEVKETHEKGQAELNKLADDFKTYFADKNLNDSVEVKQAGTYVVLNFDDGILFDKGRADLKESAIQILEMVSNEILNHPGVETKIEGHTDADPISTAQFKDNMALSQARAAEVWRYFINIKNMDPATMSAEGFGEYRPVAPNDIEENKTKNRRVEIKITSSAYANFATYTD